MSWGLCAAMVWVWCMGVVLLLCGCGGVGLRRWGVKAIGCRDVVVMHSGWGVGGGGVSALCCRGVAVGCSGWSGGVVRVAVVASMCLCGRFGMG